MFMCPILAGVLCGAQVPKRAAGLKPLGRGLENQRDAVIAPALSGGLRSVVEDVAVMPAAACAMVFGARKNQFEIATGVERTGQGGKKTRPAGAAVELHLRGVDRQVAGRAMEHALAFFIVQRAAERSLGALLAQHIELLR